MALRWAAALETEKSFRGIIGHRDLQMLRAPSTKAGEPARNR
jgi:hypothetical protein